MGRDIAITYKRKRFSSRINGAHVNLHSLLPSKISEPNSSAKVTEEYKHEKKRQKLSSGEKSSELEEKSPSTNLKDTAGENAQSAAAQITKDSVKQSSFVHGREGVQASREIDLNLPLGYGSEENNHTGRSKFHSSVNSSHKMKGKMSIFPKKNAEYGSSAVVVGDKGKGHTDSSLVLNSTSSKNNYLRLFRESRGNVVISPSNNHQSPIAYTLPSRGKNQLNPETVQSLLPPGLYTQPRQMINAYASNSSLFGRPNLSFYGRPNLQLQSTSDNMLTRSGSTTWTEEELDSLWICVRRHGKGNWATMLRDQRLKFMQWKRPQDLAHRWEVEQSRLHHSNPMVEEKHRQFRRPLPNVASAHGHSRTQWLNQPVFGAIGSCQHPNMNTGSFTSLLRQLEMQSVMKARCSIPPLVIGRANTEQDDNKLVEVIVLSSDASSEETISDDHTVRP